MRNLLCMLSLSLLVTVSIFANDRYQAGMQSSFELMQKAEDANGFVSSAQRFGRIAAAEKNDWKSHYHSAYCYIIASFIDKDSDKRDGYLDLAQTSIDAALELAKLDKQSSEITTIQAYLYMARTAISPMLRGMTYGPKASATIEKAIELDQSNPRAHFLKGQNLYYTPSMFGGGEEAALPNLKQAQQLYNESTVCEDSFEPDWGADRNEALLEKIKQQ